MANSWKIGPIGQLRSPLSRLGPSPRCHFFLERVNDWCGLNVFCAESLVVARFGNYAVDYRLSRAKDEVCFYTLESHMFRRCSLSLEPGCKCSFLCLLWLQFDATVENAIWERRSFIDSVHGSQTFNMISQKGSHSDTRTMVRRILCRL